MCIIIDTKKGSKYAVFKIKYIEWCLWEHTKTKRKRKRSKKQ